MLQFVNKKCSGLLKGLPRGFMEVFANASWLMGGQIFQLVVGFLVSVRFARYLGPSDFGVFNYILAITSLFSVFSLLGLDKVVVQEFIDKKTSYPDIFGSVFLLKLVGGIVLILGSVLTVYFANGFDRLLLLLTAILGSMYLFHAFNVIDLYFKSKLLSKYQVISRNIGFLVSIALKVLGLILGFDLVYFASLYVVDAFIMVLGFLYYVKKLGYGITIWRFDRSICKRLLKRSWPLALAGISIILYMRIDQVMIKNILGDKVLGLYSVAVQISEVPNFIATMVAASVFPAIVTYFSTDKKLFNLRLKQFYQLFTFISVSIAVVVMLLSHWVINLLFGTQYLGASSILAIYIWTLVPIFWGIATGQYLVVAKQEKVAFYRTLVGAILNIILNLMLIPVWGALGAAIASLISYSFSVFVLGAFSGTRKQLWLILKSFNFVDMFLNFRSLMLTLGKK